MSEVKAEFDLLLSGYLRTLALCTGVELGVFEALSETPRTAAETARLLEIDERGADILLHALCALRLLEKQGDVFTISELSSLFLSVGSRSYAPNTVMLISYMHGRSLSLPAVLRTGYTQMTPPATPQDVRNRLRTSVMAMAEMSAELAEIVADTVDLSTVSTMLDLGCGPGTYTFAIIRRKRGIQAVVIDRPAVLETTRELIEEHEMQENITARGGDFLTGDIGSGYDLVLMSNVVHEYAPDDNRLLINRACRVMRHRGQLVINDLVLGPSRTSPEIPALFALEMLMNTAGGRTYTEREIVSWMEGAGLTDFRSIEATAANRIIAGRKNC
jgi:SAM-dependent methyltransferase